MGKTGTGEGAFCPPQSWIGFQFFGWYIHKICIAGMPMIFIWFTYIIFIFQWRQYRENRYVPWKQVLVFHVSEARDELVNQDLGNVISVQYPEVILRISCYIQKFLWGKSSYHLSSKWFFCSRHTIRMPNDSCFLVPFLDWQRFLTHGLHVLCRAHDLSWSSILTLK